MSVQAMTWAFAQPVPPKPKVVLLALANRADHETGKCWPGLELLSRETSVPERTLIRHIAALVRNGYVVKEKTRGPNGTQRNNTYYLILDRDESRFGPWQFAAPHVDDDGEPEEPESDDDSVVIDETDDPQDVAVLGAKMAPGSNGQPTATSGTQPTAIGGTHKPSSEPKSSKTSTETRTPKIGFSREAQDAEIERTQLSRLAEKSMARVFVLKDSRAWKSWCAYRARNGQVGSLPETWADHEGRRRCGWYMPTLFPPGASESESSEQASGVDPPPKKPA